MIRSNLISFILSICLTIWMTKSSNANLQQAQIESKNDKSQEVKSIDKFFHPPPHLRKLAAVKSMLIYAGESDNIFVDRVTVELKCAQYKEVYANNCPKLNISAKALAARKRFDLSSRIRFCLINKLKSYKENCAMMQSKDKNFCHLYESLCNEIAHEIKDRLKVCQLINFNCQIEKEMDVDVKKACLIDRKYCTTVEKMIRGVALKEYYKVNIFSNDLYSWNPKKYDDFFCPYYANVCSA